MDGRNARAAGLFGRALRDEAPAGALAVDLAIAQAHDAAVGLQGNERARADLGCVLDYLLELVALAERLGDGDVERGFGSDLGRAAQAGRQRVPVGSDDVGMKG